MADASMPSPGPGAAISAETVAALEHALRAHLADRSSPALGTALRRLSHEARARGLHAEHVIILLKQLWQTIPGASAAASPRERAQVLEQVVTMSIDAYYEDVDPAGADPRGTAGDTR